MLGQLDLLTDRGGDFLGRVFELLRDRGDLIDPDQDGTDVAAEPLGPLRSFVHLRPEHLAESLLQRLRLAKAADAAHQVERIDLVVAAFAIDRRPSLGQGKGDPLLGMHARALLFLFFLPDHAPVMTLGLETFEEAEHGPGERAELLDHVLREGGPHFESEHAMFFVEGRQRLAAIRALAGGQEDAVVPVDALGMLGRLDDHVMGLDDEAADDPGRRRDVEPVFDPPHFGPRDLAPGDGGSLEAEPQGHEAALFVLHVVRQFELLHTTVKHVGQARVLLAPNRVESLVGDLAPVSLELVVLHYPANRLGEPLRLEHDEVLEIDAVGEVGDEAQGGHEVGHMVEAPRFDLLACEDIVEVLPRDVGAVVSFSVGLLSHRRLGRRVACRPGRTHHVQVGGQAPQVRAQCVDVLARGAAHGEEAIVVAKQLGVVAPEPVQRHVGRTVLALRGHQHDAGAGGPGTNRVQPVLQPVDSHLLAALEDHQVQRPPGEEELVRLVVDLLAFKIPDVERDPLGFAPRIVRVGEAPGPDVDAQRGFLLAEVLPPQRPGNARLALVPVSQDQQLGLVPLGLFFTELPPLGQLSQVGQHGRRALGHRLSGW